MKKITVTKITKALDFYLSMTSLKEVERSGWLDWGVKRNRIESVAEHVYGTQQLAYAIWSEFDILVNIDRVIAMLAVHETEEPIIGDISLASDLRKYKKEIGKIATESILDGMKRKSYVQDLIDEFEEGKTPEAKYAKFIDKLECDIQAKLYS